MRYKYKISAIVSTYNSSEFMQGCLDNLAEQTVREQLEILVIDSGSQENEGQIVKRFIRTHDLPKVRYVRTDFRETQYRAWNRAARLVRGKYITTANTDDRSRADAYEILSRALDREKRIALVYSDYYFTTVKNDSFKKRTPSRIFKRMPEYSALALFRFNICGPRPMYRRAVHEKIGYFNPRCVCTGDYEFWLRLSEFYRMKRIPIPLALYYLNTKGLYLGSGKGIAEARDICAKYLRGDYQNGYRSDKFDGMIV